MNENSVDRSLHAHLPGQAELTAESEAGVGIHAPEGAFFPVGDVRADRFEDLQAWMPGMATGGFSLHTTGPTCQGMGAWNHGA